MQSEPDKKEYGMKKFKRMLAGLVCAVMLCAAAPSAFAAKVLVYFDPNGGVTSSAVERTNDDGQLTGLPSAAMEGYTFDGWYTTGTDDVTGFPIDVQVTAYGTVFQQDATVYAHWSANGGNVEVKAEEPVEPENAATVMGLAAGSVLLVIVASMLI